MNDAYAQFADRSRSGRARRPNVVVALADQWRGDALGIEGHPVVHTPHLDQLALQGTRFRRAYSSSPTCLPARASLYTGLAPRTHGRIGYQDEVPWPYPTTLARTFTRAGYQTQAIGKLHVYPERDRMGFEAVTLHSALGIRRSATRRGADPERVDDYVTWVRARLGPAFTGHDHGLDSNSTVARPWDKPEHVHYTNFVVEEALDFLRRRDPTAPFFLFLGFNAPHPPYDPPAWAFDLYRDAEMPDPPVGDWREAYDAFRVAGLHNAFVTDLDGRWLRRTRAGYYGHMTHIDLQLNRFLEALDQHGLREETVVVFLSDHGELMGDHGLFRKGLPYEGSTRVPFIATGPGIVPGAVRDDLIEMRDVMPTLLDLAGVPVPDALDGRSFAPALRGHTYTGRDWLHGEHPFFGHAVHWITDERWKYVWRSGDGHEQLFDLAADPQELRDLARQPEHAEHLASQRARLIEALADAEEGFVVDGALVAGRPVRPVLRWLREAAQAAVAGEGPPSDGEG